jgi:hypothetical protein
MENPNKFQSESNGGVATAVPQIDATALAWLAEEAHGRQGKTLKLIKKANGKLELRETDPGSGEESLLEVITPPEAAQMTRPKEIILTVPGGQPEPLHKLEGCDALFWTTSSVEKFLFPYYSAHRLLTEQQMNELKSECHAKNAVAVVHVAPSKSSVRTGKDSYMGMDSFAVFRAGTTERPAAMVGLREFLAGS